MGYEMLTDDQLNILTSKGELQEEQLDGLFNLLDCVGVGALWVDKNFEHYKYNKSNTHITDTVKIVGDGFVPYTELLKVFYETYKHNQKDTYSLMRPSEWMAKMREQQKNPMVPLDDCVVLSATGKHFVSRRVFLNNGSMLVISLDYTSLNKRDDLIKLAYSTSKSGAIRLNLSDKSFVIASPYLERILTREEYEGVQKNGLFHIIHADDLSSSKDSFVRSLKSTLPIRKNIRLKTQKMGELWFKYTGQCEKDEDGNSGQHISIFEDITEEMKVQEKLHQNIQRSNSELKERLDFMAKLSHELKTPMNAIVGISDALIHSGDITDTVKSKLELIQSSSEVLVNMLDETLSHAKLKSENTSLNLKEHDPEKVVGDICDLWEHQALKKGTLISFQPAHDLPKKIILDRFRLRQCLNNLISNAAKFTEYGQIDVIVKPYCPPNQPEQLAIVVRDNGIGMTQEQMSTIFEAYKQADSTISSRFGGTGLGMSITKDLIELMGGKITVNSVPNKGTLFLILLPVEVVKADAIPNEILNTVQEETSIDVPQTPQMQHAPSRQVNAAETHTSPVTSSKVLKEQTASERIIEKSSIDPNELKTLNVLVVDDNETNHIVMSSLLDGVVGKIYSAFNGQEALDTLKIEHIDLILMDIHMPIMDGIEATIAIRTNPDIYSDVRIIALTADPQYQQKRLCVNIGMDEAMAKPVKLLDLVQTIKKTMAKPINRLSQAS